MSRWKVSSIWVLMAFAAVAQAQKSQPSNAQPPKDQNLPVEEGQLPPDEDNTAKAEEHYSFNPLLSKKDVTVGEFYFKKGDFKAAAGRFREATKWNDGNAEAWLRLGDAEERMNDTKSAHDAWQKYLQLAPQAKNAAEIRKKIEKIKS